MLFLMIFYVLFIMAHKFIKEEDKAIRISSLIAIVGIINIPIIKYSVEWWNTLHQSQSIKLLDGTSTIHTSMLVPLMLMLLVLLLYCALIFLMKYKTEIIRIKKKILKDYDKQLYFNERLRFICMAFVWNNHFSLRMYLLQNL